MKQTIFTFLFFALIGLMSCRKTTVDPNIKQYDQTQIQNYISANGLTDFQRDTSGGDTTGMYYKLILKGSGAPLQYSDDISFVFTIRSFDGLYTSVDTINNHFDTFLGHIVSSNLPAGLQLAIHNVLKYRGASMRLLIPSHLAYGINGNRKGSVQVANAGIAGNQCLDYYVHVIDNQAAYDDMTINTYMQANSLTGYTKTASGLYYLIKTPGTGVIGSITDVSTVTSNYKGTLFNGAVFDDHSTTTLSYAIDDGIAGVKEALENHCSVGTVISMIIPSSLAYGKGSIAASGTSAGIPPNSCLRFEWTVVSVTP